MKYIAFILCLLVASPSLAVDAIDKAEQTKRLREEAKSLVHEAYEKARHFCSMYPSADHTVSVRSGEDTLSVTVKCEVVNAYFAGRIR